jgi:hypothetical protein
MGEDSFLGLRSLAVLLVVLGALYAVSGLADARDYPVPGYWSVCSGVLMWVAAVSVWRLKVGGWIMAIGAFAVQVVGWAILRYALLGSMVAAAGLSEPQSVVLIKALDDRLNTCLIIGLLVAMWVYPGRERFDR